MVKDLYREVILQHYQNPRNRRPLDRFDLEGSAQNPLCGDEITIFASVVDDHIAEAGFQARGCSISQASADMMADAIRGKSLDETLSEIDRFKTMMETDEDMADDMGELESLISVKQFPIRVKCAVMPWVTLGEAIARYRAGA